MTKQCPKCNSEVVDLYYNDGSAIETPVVACEFCDFVAHAEDFYSSDHDLLIKN